MKIVRNLPTTIKSNGKNIKYFIDDESSELNFIMSKSIELIPGYLPPGEVIMDSDYWSELTCNGIDFDAEASLDLLEEFRLIELRYYKLLSKGFTPKQAISML